MSSPLGPGGKKRPESLQFVWLWWWCQCAGFRQLGCEISSEAPWGYTTLGKKSRADVKGTAWGNSASRCSLASHASWLPTNLSGSVQGDKYQGILYKLIADHWFEWAVLLQKYSQKITEAYLWLCCAAHAVQACTVPQALHVFNAFSVTRLHHTWLLWVNTAMSYSTKSAVTSALHFHTNSQQQLFPLAALTS